MKSGTECERCAPAVEICGGAIRLLAGVSPEYAPCCFLWMMADSGPVRAAFSALQAGLMRLYPVRPFRAPTAGCRGPTAPGPPGTYRRSPHRGTKLPESTAQFCPTPLARWLHFYAARIPETRSGAPSPARGPRSGRSTRRGSTRDTPACAGTTGRSSARSAASTEHPRLRGDHWASTNATISIAGTAPPARGPLFLTCEVRRTLPVLDLPCSRHPPILAEAGMPDVRSDQKPGRAVTRFVWRQPQALAAEFPVAGSGRQGWTPMEPLVQARRRWLLRVRSGTAPVDTIPEE